MNINTIYNFSNPIYKNSKQNISNNTEAIKEKPFEQIPVRDISSDSIRANFFPSFGRYKKTGSTQIYDKTEQKSVSAEIKREQVDNFVSYKIVRGKDEVGSMNMNLCSLFPEGDFIISLPKNVIPKVTSIESSKEDKYGGVASALMQEAIQESCKVGEKGRLWLVAEKSSRKYSKNPIPFYYKFGFKSPDNKTDEHIKNCIASGKYDKLPNSAVLIRTSNNAQCIPIPNRSRANIPLDYRQPASVVS